jgi:hypothetical protein
MRLQDGQLRLHRYLLFGMSHMMNGSPSGISVSTQSQLMCVENREAGGVAQWRSLSWFGPINPVPKYLRVRRGGGCK